MEQILFSIEKGRRGRNYEILVYRDESSPVRHTGFILIIDNDLAYTIDFGAQDTQTASKSFVSSDGAVTSELITIVKQGELTPYWTVAKFLQQNIDGRLLTVKKRSTGNKEYGVVSVLSTTDQTLVKSIVRQMFQVYEQEYLATDTSKNCRGYVDTHIKLIREKVSIEQETVDNINKLLGITVVEDWLGKLLGVVGVSGSGAAASNSSSKK
jgi:hypothetical protein